MIRRKNRPALAACILCLFALGGTSLWGDDGAFLNKIDDAINFTDSDFSAVYAITQQKTDGSQNGLNISLFRRDRNAEFLVLIREPEVDKGKGYLMHDGSIVFYDPAERRFTFTSAKDAFRNTNARNSDFTLSRLALYYKVVSSTTERLGKLDCRRLELEATSSEAPFPKKTIWATADGALRMSKEYSLSSQLLRTVAFQYSTLDGRLVPAKIMMIDELKKAKVGDQVRKETTTIVVSRQTFESLPAALFTQTYLENLSQ
jgi:hypothetical protein